MNTGIAINLRIVLDKTSQQENDEWRNKLK